MVHSIAAECQRVARYRAQSKDNVTIRQPPVATPYPCHVREHEKVAPSLLVHLRRARDHVDRHYREPLDLDVLAAVAGVSKYHFVRCFEATYGETPMRYLTRRRIERAQDLCMVVGYSSLGSFSSRFTQLVGETPTAYRDRWAATGGARVPGCWVFMRAEAQPGRRPPPPGRPTVDR